MARGDNKREVQLVMAQPRDTDRAATLLVIDDEENSLKTLSRALQEAGFSVHAALSLKQARQVLESKFVDLLLVDEILTPGSGIEFLEECTQAHGGLNGIVISGVADPKMAIRAMRAGVLDFLEKDEFNEKDLVDCVDKALLKSRHTRAARFARWGETFPKIVWRSAVIGNLLEQVKLVGPSDSGVLITGPSGSGKELIAGAIVSCSHRSKKPFVRFNCAAVPEDLIESELFGHEKGAFTGAHEKKIGRFQKAHTGTIFLDEVADMSAKTQAKLLRVLRERTLELLGSEGKEITVDIRVIAATNKDLEALVKDGKFREDLYYRLKVVTLSVPGLRERVDDIRALAEYHLRELEARWSRPTGFFTIDQECVDLMKNYPWPGNVGELLNAVERAAIFATDGVIKKEALKLDVEADTTGVAVQSPNYSLDWASAEFEFRRVYWKRVRDVAKDSKTKAAEISGFHRATVDTHLKEIDKQEKVEQVVKQYLESLPKDKRDERLEASKKALLEKEDRKLSEDDLTEEQWRDIAGARLRRQVAEELNLKSADE